MNLTEFIEKWGKTLVESPLATRPRPDDPPELAEQLGYSPASIGKVTTRCLAALTRHLFASGIYRRKTP